MLEVIEIVKRYRRGALANDGVSLRVDAGEVLGLLGPNGAGKTTLVRQIVGLQRPTSGCIRIDGVDVVAHPAQARRSCSFQPQTPLVIAALSPRRAITLIGRMRGGRRPLVRRRADELLRSLDLEPWAETPVERLSGGVRRLVGFCMAAVVPGQVVILDEPTDEVDPVRRRLLWGEVRALAAGGAAVLLVTHNVQEAEQAVDQVGVLDRGRMAYLGPSSELKGVTDSHFALDLVLAPSGLELSVPPFASTAVQAGRRLLLRVPAHALVVAATWAQDRRSECLIEEFSIGAPTLEEAYVRLIGGLEPHEREASEGHAVLDR